MAFAKQLERLRHAAYERHRGAPQPMTYVRREDLVELLRQFDRLDRQAREDHRRRHPEQYPTWT